MSTQKHALLKRAGIKYLVQLEVVDVETGEHFLVEEKLQRYGILGYTGFLKIVAAIDRAREKMKTRLESELRDKEAQDAGGVHG